MALLCSGTGLVGPVSKGQWRLSWTSCRYGGNLGSLTRSKLEMPIKWTEASRFSSYKEGASYTIYCEGDVHCGVWHWWNNTAQHCTSKIDGKRSLLMHVHAAPPSSSAQEETTTLGGTEPHHSSWQCKESHRCCCHGPLTPLAMGDSEHPPYFPDISPCDYDIFAKVKEPLRGTRYSTRDELIL